MRSEENEAMTENKNGSKRHNRIKDDRKREITEGAWKEVLGKSR